MDIDKDDKSTAVSSDAHTGQKSAKLTIADPLLHDVGDDIPAHISPWEHLSHVGIQNIVTDGDRKSHLQTGLPSGALRGSVEQRAGRRTLFV